MRNLDIHRYDKELKRHENHIRGLDISDRNKQLILKYVQFRSAQGLSKARQATYYDKLSTVARILKKDFDQATKEDLMRVVGALRTRDYTSETLMTILSVVKCFYRYVYPQPEEDDYPVEVRWIRVKSKKDHSINPLHLLTEKDVDKLLKLPMHTRDRAFLITLFESGCRIGEIGNATVGDLSFDEYGAILTTGQSKTFVRPIRLVAAASYLAQWVGMHPHQKDMSAPLWVSLEKRTYGQHVSYEALRKLPIKYFALAGINKPANPHWFRHSRQTILATLMTHAQQCAYAGWKQGSQMPSIYIHLSGRGVEDPILQHYGIEKDKSEHGSMFKPIQCAKCSTSNAYNASICEKCSVLLQAPGTAIHATEGNAGSAIQGVSAVEIQALLKDAGFHRLLGEFLKARAGKTDQTESA